MLPTNATRKMKVSPIDAGSRSPYVIDTVELGRRPGTQKSLAFVVPALVGMRNEVIGVPDGSDLQIDMRLEAVMEGVLISGTASGQAVGECARCLDPIEYSIEVPFQELFAYPSDRHMVAAAEDDVVYELVEDEADIEPVIRDAVVLSLPFRPVCREDCLGLCAECGVRLDENPGHRHETQDPRWAALTAVFDEREES